jgi:hypothetical protein
LLFKAAGIKPEAFDVDYSEFASGHLWRASDEAVTGAPEHLMKSENLSMIQPGTTFKDNLQQLPPVDQVQRIDLVDGQGAMVASIENQPGKQGSLAVYHYLKQVFGNLDARAAEHGLAVFAEHTVDARQRPGAHPNVDRLIAIADGGGPLSIEVIPASR